MSTVFGGAVNPSPDRRIHQCLMLMETEMEGSKRSLEGFPVLKSLRGASQVRPYWHRYRSAQSYRARIRLLSSLVADVPHNHWIWRECMN
jgi:hypothetical protein